ncbi:MAG: hypothetical protein H0W99_07515 [Acidobacteria bacterium]|nr:hypothetical protein [Acidobacteriota bacterium]
MRFQRECVRDLWDELMPLLLENNLETGSLDQGEFEPMREQYENIADLGMHCLFTARENEELAGYGSYFVNGHLHFPRQKWAVQDALFMRKEHRGIASVRFLKWSDQELKALGVTAISRQVNRNTDYSRTLERLDYQPIEISYLRRF